MRTQLTKRLKVSIDDSDALCQQLVAKIDANKDGKVSKAEVLSLTKINVCPWCNRQTIVIKKAIFSFVLIFDSFQFD